jgi:hypothetical protein
MSLKTYAICPVSDNKVDEHVARIGLIFSCLIIISFVLNSFLPAYSLTGVQLLFSFLEAAYGICVACEIYPFVYRILYKVKFQ